MGRRKIVAVSRHDCPDGSVLLLVTFTRHWLLWLLTGVEYDTSLYAWTPAKLWVSGEDSRPLDRQGRAEVHDALVWLKEKADAEANR